MICKIGEINDMKNDGAQRHKKKKKSEEKTRIAIADNSSISREKKISTANRIKWAKIIDSGSIFFRHERTEKKRVRKLWTGKRFSNRNEFNFTIEIKFLIRQNWFKESFSSWVPVHRVHIQARWYFSFYHFIWNIHNNVFLLFFFVQQLICLLFWPRCWCWCCRLRNKNVKNLHICTPAQWKHNKNLILFIWLWSQTKNNFATLSATIIMILVRLMAVLAIFVVITFYGHTFISLHWLSSKTIRKSWSSKFWLSEKVEKTERVWERESK